MNKLDPVDHKALDYTSQESAGQRVFNYLFALFIVIISIIMFIFGLYYWANADNADNGVLAAVLLPVSVLLGLSAIVVIYMTDHHKRYVYRFELNADGILEEKIYPKQDKVEKSYIPFGNMDKILIGNYVEYVYRRVKGADLSHYKFGLLLIIIHKEGTFFQRFSDQDELDGWIIRFKDKEIPIFYTEYNLINASRDHSYYNIDIDFNEIKAIPWDDVKEPPIIGHTDRDNPYEHWESEDVNKLREKIKQDKTRKAERHILVVLFVYAIFVGGIVIPQLRLDANNDLELTNIIFIFGVLVTVFIPIIGVYWRSFTKWYLPIPHFLVTILGNSLALFIASIFLSIPTLTLFGYVIALNALILFFGWIPGLLIIKVLKALFTRSFINKI